MDPTRQPGIQFNAVLLRKATYHELPAEETPSKVGRLQLSIGAEHRYLPDEENAEKGELRLRVSVEPEGDPAPFFVEVVLSGMFSYVEGEAKNLDLAEFFREQAPALLLPFAREAITNLTARSRFAPVLIPPVNLRALAQEGELLVREGE